MRNLVSFFLFGLLVFLPGFGAQYEERTFDQEELSEYRNDPDFDYSEEYAKGGSLLTLLIAYVLEKFFSLFQGSGIEWLLPWVFRALIILVIIGLVIYIVRNRYGPIFVSGPGTYAPGGIVSAEDHSVDYDQMIKESVNNSEYKLAIRYLFLKSLNMLNEKGIISIKQWKAPYDYLLEIPTEKKEDFQELTDLFEVTWYGEYDADETIYLQGVEVSKKLAG